MAVLGPQKLQDAMAWAEASFGEEIDAYGKARRLFYELEASTELHTPTTRTALGVFALETGAGQHQTKQLEQVYLSLRQIFEAADKTPFVSNLGDYYCRTEVAMAEHYFTEASFDKARWHARRALQEKQVHNDKQSRAIILLSLCYLRQGFGQAFISVLQENADLLLPEDRQLAALLKVRQLRWAARLPEAIAAAQVRLENPELDATLRSQFAWEESLARYLQTNDPFHLVRACHKKNDPPPSAKTIAYLLSISSQEKVLVKRLQRPRNIIRTDRDVLRNYPDEQAFVQLAARVDDLSTGELGDSAVMGLLEKARLLRELDWQLAIFLATARVVSRWGGASGLSTEVYLCYQKLSLTVTGGISADAFLKGQDLEENLTELKRTAHSPALLRTDLNSHRLWRLSKLSTVVAGKIIGSRLRRLMTSARESDRIAAETSVIVAELILRDIQKLRGALMKFVQFGSAFHAILPSEVREALKGVYYEAQSMPASEAQSIVEESLGDSPQKIFKKWHSEPVANGAFGQVHVAESHDNQMLAVKIKYPGIEKSVRADMRSLRNFSWFFSSMFPQSDPKASIKDWERILILEADYEREMRFYEESRALLLESESRHAFVPKIHPVFCSKDVLTADLVKGESVGEFLTRADQHEKDHLGVQIVRSNFELMKGGVFKYDFHPGNYIVTGDKLALVDFGAAHHLDPDATTNYLAFFRSAITGDLDSFTSFITDAGFVTDPTHFDFEAFLLAHQDVYLRPFMGGDFEFTPEFAAEVVQWVLKKAPGIEFLTIPPGFLTLMRFYWSLYSMLGDIRPKADWRQVVADCMDIQEEEPATVAS